MISKDHTWGGDLELGILSKLYNCEFIIHALNRPDISVSITTINDYKHKCIWNLRN